MDEVLSSLQPGMPIVFGGNRVAYVSEEMAGQFRPGDRLVVIQDTGDMLHIPAVEWGIVNRAIETATNAFGSLGVVSDDRITAFYNGFADRLQDDTLFETIAEANARDVEKAEETGRSTTRLILSDRMRVEMVAGLRIWADGSAGRGEVDERLDHPGWILEQVRSGLGVVGFVFEGRPNVVADATGVIRSGNTVVLRIGSDALGTARAIIQHALDPALEDSGLPEGTVTLVDTPSRAAGWAMFSDHRLGLAVARGSGAAVSQLGSVAKQAGVPVSLHGTGGAWIVASHSAGTDELASAVYHSLDRKVCNTLNTMCVVESRAEELVPVFLDALDRAGERLGTKSKLHVTEAVRHLVPDRWFETVSIDRATGAVAEPQAEIIGSRDLGVEWEWEGSPEVTLTVVPSVDEAVLLFNDQSPRFAASLISDDLDEQSRFFQMIDAPFVGNGFTRWIDGQYALNRPELGLSNWQHGRLFGRGGILSGDSVHTIRTRVVQSDPNIGR